MAIQALVSGLKFTKDFETFQETNRLEDEVKWTLTHTMYANMGGFIIRFATPEGQSQLSGEDTSQNNFDKWLEEFRIDHQTGYRYLGPFDWDPHPEHLILAKANINARGYDQDPTKDMTARALSGSVWALNAPQLLEARRRGIILQLPSITENEINDKNKGDTLIKLLAVLQVTWLGIQLIIRAVEGRQSSQLEITALALAFCAFATYLLLMWQPKDIRTPTVTLAQRSADEADFKILVDLYSENGLLGRRKHYGLDEFGQPKIRNDHLLRNLDWYGLGLGLFIFGCIHLLGWNFQFPSAVEHLLWRISGILVACLPLAFLLLKFDDDDNEGWWNTSLICLVIAGVVVFTFARLFLLVEAFRSTYYLPPSSYIATWANNIPHVG